MNLAQASVHQQRVLLSSEDPHVVAELTRQARLNGIRLFVTDSGRMLDQVRSLSPELVIIDVQQKIDGRLLLARLKQDPRTRSCRIAVLNGNEDGNVFRFCRENRAAHYQLKPTPPDYLDTLVRVRESVGWVALRAM